MVKVKRAALEAIALAARNTYPEEFIALLGNRKKGNNVIDEFVVLPATYGKAFSSIRRDLLPFDKSIMGSVHSHPGPNAMPSRADLKAFKAMGEIHLIIAKPFNLGSVRAFDSSGKELELEVLE